MAEQIPNGHLPLRRNRFYPIHTEKQQLGKKGRHAHPGLEFIPFVRADPHVRKRGQILSNGVIQPQLARLHQFQNSDCGYHLGHGCHAENRILGDRYFLIPIRIAPLAVEHHLVVLSDDQCAACHFLIGYVLVHYMMDCFGSHRITSLIFSAELRLAFLAGDLSGIATSHECHILIFQFVENHNQNAQQRADEGNQSVNDPHHIQSFRRLGHTGSLQVLKTLRRHRNVVGQTENKQSQGSGYTGGQLGDEGGQGIADTGAVFTGLITGVLNGIRQEEVLRHSADIAEG